MAAVERFVSQCLSNVFPVYASGWGLTQQEINHSVWFIWMFSYDHQSGGGKYFSPVSPPASVLLIKNSLTLFFLSLIPPSKKWTRGQKTGRKKYSESLKFNDKGSTRVRGKERNGWWEEIGVWEVEEGSKAECTRRNQGKRGDERRKNE